MRVGMILVALALCLAGCRSVPDKKPDSNDKPPVFRVVRW